jgi:ABC-2 type transport system ATP-binding protein
MSLVIQTHLLTKRFRHTKAVESLNLEVGAGSIYALVGPNGAGKSTTIKLLMNILRPTAGGSQVLGTPSARLGPPDFARIGYVSENQELPEWMTVEYFLKYCRGFYERWDNALADELLRQFELPPGRRLRHLSRGMKMKAALVSSLAHHPSLLILDEPFNGLDPLVRDELVESVLDRAEETTVFIASHDLAELESFATHVGYLEQGRLHFSEELAALSARVREVEVSLESPPALPAQWPGEWLPPEASAALVRFVDTRFDHERTEAAIRGMFPAVREITVRALPLRSIFIAIARASRRTAA